MKEKVIPMGKSNRIRVTRADTTVSNAVKFKKKQGMPLWLQTTIAIVATLAVLASCTPAGTGDDTDGVTDTVVVTDKWGQASVSHEVPEELDYQGVVGFHQAVYRIVER